MGCAGSKEGTDVSPQQPEALGLPSTDPAHQQTSQDAAHKVQQHMRTSASALAQAARRLSGTFARMSASFNGSEQAPAAGTWTVAQQGENQPVTGALPLDDNPDGLNRPDSPETMRITQRSQNKPKQDDGIVTVWETEEDDGYSPTLAPVGGDAKVRKALGRGNGAWTSNNGSDPGIPGSIDSSDEDARHSTMLLRLDSTKARQSAVLTLRQAPQSGASIEEGLLLLGPNGQTTQPRTLLQPLSELVLDLSDDEDEEDSAAKGFSMQRWKKYYSWNKSKHKELLGFLWKRFDPETWTLYCITWKNQDALSEVYQADNIIHGLSCRLSDLMANTRPVGEAKTPLVEQLFGILVTLLDKQSSGIKVVGVLLAHGKSSFPSCLHHLPELATDWLVRRADVSDPLVRTFVSNLITARPPFAQYEVVAKRELV